MSDAQVKSFHRSLLNDSWGESRLEYPISKGIKGGGQRS